MKNEISPKIGLLLHLYQPLTQDPGVFHDITSASYLPLLKFIKNRKDFKVTLNVPLSLLQQMEKYGYLSWVDQLRELVDAGRVELTGSAAYHPLLTKLPLSFIEKQIILNEYGLGYYVGRRAGFEGEPSVMLKNLNGFFPPEMAVNEELVSLLDELGYKWVVMDECAIPGGLVKKGGLYKLGDTMIKLVVRDREISNVLSFKRNGSVEDIMHLLLSRDNYIVALDGETFGHHNRDGMYLLESFVDAMHNAGREFVTVSELIEHVSPTDIEHINESTWAAVEEGIENGDAYPMWHRKNNELQKKMWDLYKDFISLYDGREFAGSTDDYETLPIWNEDKLSVIDDPTLRESLKKDMYISQALSSDQFWWASNKEMPDGKVLFDAGMIKRSMEAYKRVLDLENDTVKTESIRQELEKVLSAVRDMDNRIY